MDWGNAIVRKITRSPAGDITHIDLDLHLAGDFKATEKKITWLAKPTDTLPLVSVTLLDYDYMVTKRKLEKEDEVAAVRTPQTEFRVDVLADANILSLKEHDTIQFERKGYYILDKIVEDDKTKEKRFEFIRIPDGRAAGIALKAPGGTSVPAPEEGKSVLEAGSAADPSIKMYKVDPVNKIDNIELPTTMYKVDSVYKD